VLTLLRHPNCIAGSQKRQHGTGGGFFVHPWGKIFSKFFTKQINAKTYLQRDLPRFQFPNLLLILDFKHRSDGN